MRGRLALLAVVAAALAGPAGANAADHFWLSASTVSPTDGWALSTSVTSPDFDPITRNEILGVTLARRWSARVRETHALRLHHTQGTISFDGQRGRWRTAGSAGGAVSVDMRITATSEPAQVAAGASLPFACRGSFLRSLVTLHGTFVLRTRTAAFRTIRRVHLTGVMTYNSGGPVQCGTAAGGSCEGEAHLSASSGRASVFAEPSRRKLIVSFPESSGWYHNLALSGLSVSGAEPPSIRIQVPANPVARGTLTFTAAESSEAIEGACRVTTTRGTLAGRLHVHFTGWGARTFAATTATFRRTSGF